MDWKSILLPKRVFSIREFRMSDTTSQVPPAPLPPESPSSAAADLSRPCGQRLRLWPGVLIIVLQWLLITVPGWVVPGNMTHFLAMFWGPILGLIALAAWWLFGSRLRWADRWLGLLACGAAAAAAWP